MEFLLVGLEEIAALPWPNIAGFFTCVGLLLFTFGPKIPFVVRFFSSGVQNMTGVTGLREDLQHESDARTVQHAENQVATQRLLDAIEQHAADAAIHYKGGTPDV